MRALGYLMTLFLVTACISEVKPLLKPTEVGIEGRITSQQKWLEQDIAAKAITREQARPITNKLNQIKEKYDRLQSTGPLTAKDSEDLNRMLDDTSNLIFRATQKHQKVLSY